MKLDSNKSIVREVHAQTRGGKYAVSPGKGDVGGE